MRKTLKLSIIIPLYNTPKEYFAECLKSIRDQKLPSGTFETIVVNDCSTINYDDLFKEYKDLSLSVISPNKNSGPGVCRRLGVERAQGRYVTFIDSDDAFYDSSSLIRLLAMANKNSLADMVCGRVMEELQDGTRYYHPFSFIWCFAKLYKLKFLKDNNINFNDTRGNEDNSFCTLCSICTDRIVTLDEPVYLWKYQPTSITRKNNHEFYFKEFQSYVYNMTWVYYECKKRKIDTKVKCLHHCAAVWIKLYLHYLEVFQKRNEVEARKIIDMANQFYEEVYSKVEDKITRRIFTSAWEVMTKDATRMMPNISFPEFVYRATVNNDEPLSQKYEYISLF